MGTSTSFDQLAGKLRKAGKDLTTAERRAWNEAGLYGKRAALEAIGERSDGFERHRKRTGKKHFVRYRRKDDPHGGHLALWAVPPGPYLLQGGSAGPYRGKAPSWGGRRLHPTSLPRVRPRPWASVLDRVAPRMEQMIETAQVRAFMKHF